MITRTFSIVIFPAFPIWLTIAIAGYRLLDMDLIINAPSYTMR